jgi:hypothetical protein
MRIRLPPKNMNQGIYWVSTYLKYNLDKPARIAKPKQPTKQEEYRAILHEIRSCFEQDEYPVDIIEFIDEIHRVLNLKSITSKHMEKIYAMRTVLIEKYAP